MHLHGFYFEVDSRGSWAGDTVYPPAERRMAVTELMPPGGTMAVRWTPGAPGQLAVPLPFRVSHLGRPAALGAAGHGGRHPAASRTTAWPAWCWASTCTSGRARPDRQPGGRAAEPVEPRRDSGSWCSRRAPPADSAHLMGYALQEGGLEPAARLGADPGTRRWCSSAAGRCGITVVNRLAEPTAVHWHGIELESYPDGVPGWSGTDDRLFRAIAPGDSFAAEFTPPRAGTFIYHSHANELVQIQGGLYGPLIVVEPGTTYDTASNRLVVVGGLFRNDSSFGVVNGRLEPAPIEIRAGRSYRFRLINIGDARTWLRAPAPRARFVAGGVARGGEGRRRSAAVAGGGRGEAAHGAGRDGGLRGAGG